MWGGGVCVHVADVGCVLGDAVLLTTDEDRCPLFSVSWTSASEPHSARSAGYFNELLLVFPGKSP